MHKAFVHKFKKEKKVAKSSINFKRAKSGNSKHNDRSVEPSYLLEKKDRLPNEIDYNFSEVEKKLQFLYENAKKNYKNKIGQKLQARSYIWEAVVNLNSNHKMEDLKNLVKTIEQETGFTGVQIAIHRDEGHIKNNVVMRNLHAHIIFFTLDRKTGEQLYRRQVTQKQKENGFKPMNRERLSKLQDITALSLNMQRGKKGSKSIRLDHKAYRQQKQTESKEENVSLARIKDVQEENLKLRRKLQEMGAKREDYAILEERIRFYKDLVREGAIERHKMQNEVLKLMEDLSTKIDSEKLLQEKLKNTEKYAEQLLQKNEELEQTNEKQNRILSKAKQIIKRLFIKLFNEEPQNYTFSEIENKINEKIKNLLNPQKSPSSDEIASRTVDQILGKIKEERETPDNVIKGDFLQPTEEIKSIEPRTNLDQVFEKIENEKQRKIMRTPNHDDNSWMKP